MRDYIQYLYLLYSSSIVSYWNIFFSWISSVLMGSTTKRSHMTREVSPTAVSNGQLNEMYVLVLYSRLWTTGGYCHMSVEQVSVGTLVVFGHSAGCVGVASPVMGEWEDNTTSVAPEDRRCGTASVGSVHSFACSQKQHFVPDQETNDVCLGAERPRWDEVFRQCDSIQNGAEKPESRQQGASLRTTLASKELSELETETELYIVGMTYPWVGFQKLLLCST